MYIYVLINMYNESNMNEGMARNEVIEKAVKQC